MTFIFCKYLSKKSLEKIKEQKLKWVDDWSDLYFLVLFPQWVKVKETRYSDVDTDVDLKISAFVDEGKNGVSG